MTAELQELSTLWTDASAASIKRIPVLCERISELGSRRVECGDLERNLMQRVGLLAAAAQARLGACLTIQTRAATYSTGGTFEASPRVVTIGWEG